MTDTTFRLFAAARRTRSCSICGQQARPGAKLCLACKAALKRARQETVSELVPLPRRSHARRKTAPRENDRRPAAPAVSSQGRPATPAKPRLRRRDAIAVGVCAAVLGLVVYVEAPDWRTRSSRSPLPVPQLAPAPTGAPAPAAGGSSNVELPSAIPAPTTVERDDIPGGPTEMVAPTKPTGLRAPPVSANAAPSVPDTAPAAALLPTVEVPPLTVVPEPAPPPVPRAPPRPDRWQILQETIAGCGREGFFDGVVCEQKARLAACDGYWGQVPQCPSGIGNDHGQ